MTRAKLVLALVIASHCGALAAQDAHGKRIPAHDAYNGPDVAGTTEIRNRMELACDKANLAHGRRVCSLVTTPERPTALYTGPSIVEIKARLGDAR